MRGYLSRAVWRVVLVAAIFMVAAGNSSADLVEPPQARIQPPVGVAATAEPGFIDRLAAWFEALVTACDR